MGVARMPSIARRGWCPRLVTEGAQPRSRHLLALSMAAMVFTFLVVVPVRAEAQLAGTGTASLDGILDKNEWAGAAQIPILINVPEGTTPATLYVMNDHENLYIAVSVLRSAIDPGNSLSVELDANRSGSLDAGDDVMTYAVEVDAFTDAYRALTQQGVLIGPDDTSNGGTNDGAGAFSNDGSMTVYELSHPLNSGDALHDMALAAGDKVGFFIFLRILDTLGTPFDTSYPAFGYLEFQVTTVRSYELLKKLYIDGLSAFEGSDKDAALFLKPLVKGAFEGMITANPDKALEALFEFQMTAIPAAEAQGFLSPGSAKALIAESLQVIDSIGLSLSAPTCDAPLAATTVYVDAEASTAGTGTEADPYRSLFDALNHPPVADPLEIKIARRKGSYTFGVASLSRSVTIVPWVGRGAGDVRILNSAIAVEGPHRLEIASVAWKGSGKGEAAILGSGGARICLRLMSIRGASNHAIIITGPGSTLVAGLLTVRATTTRPPAFGSPLLPPVESGTAVVARDGASARLYGTLLNDNEGGGILATGVGTNVQLVLVDVIGTRLNPYVGGPAPEACMRQGGVVADDHAHAQLTSVLIHDGMGIGLIATEGATASGEMIYVAGTGSAASTWGESTSGLGIVADCEGAIDVGAFSSANNFFIGIMLLREGQPGEMDLRGGVVSGNPIGASVQVPGYDLNRLRNRTIYVDNGINLDTPGTPPTPEPSPAPIP